MACVIQKVIDGRSCNIFIMKRIGRRSYFLFHLLFPCHKACLGWLRRRDGQTARPMGRANTWADQPGEGGGARIPPSLARAALHGSFSVPPATSLVKLRVAPYWGFTRSKGTNNTQVTPQPPPNRSWILPRSLQPAHSSTGKAWAASIFHHQTFSLHVRIPCKMCAQMMRIFFPR